MTRPKRAGGVPAERTLLAWVRTALSFGGCALLLARLLQPHPAAAASAALLGVAAASGAIGAAGARYRAPARSRSPGSAPVLVFAAASAVTVLAVASLVAVLAAG
jgi:uncharacterized membrane protein YidH (DUF202 family)